MKTKHFQHWMAFSHGIFAVRLAICPFKRKKMRTRRDDAIGFRAQAKARYEKYKITHFPK